MPFALAGSKRIQNVKRKNANTHQEQYRYNNIHELRDAYRQIAAEDPNRCVLIDATPDPDVVAAQVWTALREHLFAMASTASSACRVRHHRR